METYGTIYVLLLARHIPTQVVLESYYQLADSERCVAESRGGLLHELFHVFGVIIITLYHHHHHHHQNQIH